MQKLKVSKTSNGGIIFWSKCAVCNSKKSTLKKEANNKKLEAIGSLTIRTKKKRRTIKRRQGCQKIKNQNFSKIPILGDILF